MRLAGLILTIFVHFHTKENQFQLAYLIISPTICVQQNIIWENASKMCFLKGTPTHSFSKSQKSYL
jgi:cytochrome c oxidase subunit IV